MNSRSQTRRTFRTPRRILAGIESNIEKNTMPTTQQKEAMTEILRNTLPTNADVQEKIQQLKNSINV